jgi:sugar/nucleoside kinase (ribokinase family)
MQTGNNLKLTTDHWQQATAHKPFDAVAFGLNAVDHLIVVPHFPEFNTKIPYLAHKVAPGGQCATAMVTLARLGLKTRYIGKVGNDDTGKLQINSLISEGVDTSSIIIEDGAESQTAFILIDKASGERTVIWNRDEKLGISEEEVDRDAVTSGRVLHLDGHEVRASIVAAQYAREAGIPTVLDIDNIYPEAERLLPLIDFLISSSTFPERMIGESDLRTALKILAEKNGSYLTAATLGEDGVLAYIQGEYIHSPGFKVECRDTTGAGDAFHGGFIYGMLNGYSVEEALRFSNAVAALKCLDLGARTALPRLDEVEKFLADK